LHADVVRQIVAAEATDQKSVRLVFLVVDESQPAERADRQPSIWRRRSEQSANQWMCGLALPGVVPKNSVVPEIPELYACDVVVTAIGPLPPAENENRNADSQPKEIEQSQQRECHGDENPQEHVVGVGRVEPVLFHLVRMRDDAVFVELHICLSVDTL
jgi:hypothetical protein